MNFEVLIESVKQTHIALQQNAVKAINVSLTIRNWLIGCYIVEYEQKGEDRAKYGENLLKNIEVECINNDIRGITERSLRTFRMFYQTYPQIRHTLSADFIKTLIRQTVSDELKKEIEIVVARRRDYPLRREGDFWTVGILQMGISSSYIRSLIKRHFGVKYLVTDKVARYIDKHKLYR